PCGLGAVIENMAQMRIAPAAEHFSPPHEKGIIRFAPNRLPIDGLPETRPSRSGLEFCSRCKKVLPATDTLVSAFLLIVPERTCKGAFRSLPSSDAILLG